MSTTLLSVDFSAESKAEIMEEIRNTIQTLFKEQQLDKYISPEDVCELYKISKPTLAKLTRDGILQKYYLGRKTYYVYREVIGALKVYKRYSRSSIN